MKFFAALVLLCGVVAGSSMNWWNTITKKEHEYIFTTQVHTGIPELNNQYAGLRITGKAVLQAFADRTFRAKLKDVRYKTFNDIVQLNDETDAFLPDLAEVPLVIRTQLEAPFKVILNKNGEFHQLHTEKGELEFVTNLKKALIKPSGDLFAEDDFSSMLTTNYIKKMDNQKKVTFRKMEQSVMGLCETEYTVNKLPEYLALEFEEKEARMEAAKFCHGKPYFEVLKVKNLDNCKERPIFQHNYGANAKSDGSQGATAPQAKIGASMERAIRCGDTNEFPIIRKATVEHRFLVNGAAQFEAGEKIEVAARMRFVLKDIRDRTVEIKDVAAPKVYHSLRYLFPADHYWTSTESAKAKVPLTQANRDTKFIPQAPLPGMTTGLKLVHPHRLDKEKTKQLFVETFIKFLDVAKKSPESSYDGKDANGQVVAMTKHILLLDLADIKEIWDKVNADATIKNKQNAQHVFMDLLSITATNPAAKFLADMIKQQVVRGEAAAWIAANLVRNIKTPTEELLQELTNLLKHPNVDAVRTLKATVALALTQLVHKACVDETAAVYDYPARIYGRFCFKDSDVIKKDLVPHLEQKLRETMTKFQQKETVDAKNAAVVYINALGNLGIDGAKTVLLEVVEGKWTKHAFIRSVAVYKLIRFARRNPAFWRPAILAIIHNPAENEEVRMAAISVLPYAHPRSVDLHKLAIRTWWEPSQQVVSFVYTTLESLKKLPTGSVLYQTIPYKAEQAFRLCKPVTLGIQKSHNIKIWQFLDKLKAAVNLKLQYIMARDSAFPRNIWIKNEVHTKLNSIDNLETGIYFQGAEVLLEKVYDLYKMAMGIQKPVKRENILNIKERMAKQPEAHITFKMLGLQRFYSIDSQLIQDIVKQLTDTLIKGQNNEIKKDFLKVLDLNGFHHIIPTEAGIPVYIQHRTPVVISAQASIALLKKGEAEIKIKPVVNYRKITSAGVFCPFTRDLLAAGVDTAVHVAAPLKVGVALRHGQFAVTMKTPNDMESQKERPVFDMKIHPHTLIHSIHSFNKEKKTIHARNEKRKVELQLGEKLGVDLKLKIHSEHKFVDLAQHIHELYYHKPLTLLALPLPLRTVRNHRVRLEYNPAMSVTKEAALIVSFGYGKKISATQPTTMVYPTYQEDPQIEKICKQQETEEEKLLLCMKEKFCNKEKETCQAELKGQNRPTFEINKYCSMKFNHCVQRHITRQNIRYVLGKLQEGTAVTINIEAALRGEKKVANRKIETHLTIARKQNVMAAEKSEINVQAALITAPDALPIDLEVMASTQAFAATSKWDKDAILKHDPKLQVAIKATVGRRGQEKMAIAADMKAVQSADQKMFAKQHPAALKCEKAFALGQKLNKDCKKLRTYAAALDFIETTVFMPAIVGHNPYLRTVGELVKAYFLPYMTMKQVAYTTTVGQAIEKYTIQAKVHPLGQRMTVNVLGWGQEVSLKDIRLGHLFEGLLPLRIRETPLMAIVQKLTAHGAPSSCTVEGGKVRTFDKVVYDYALNDCEHVVFKDCSPANKMEVAVRKTAQAHFVKAIIDNNKYELQILKQNKAARGLTAVVKVNGVQKHIQEGGEVKFDVLVPLKENYYIDQNTYITSYLDGVFVIVNKLYGVSVYADRESVEVKTFQHNLRNQACGLCGDLNDEKVADMKSAGNCLMTAPKFAAYSYMVADGKCQGIPAQDKQTFLQETTKCMKRVVFPTKVTKVLQQKPQIKFRHLVQERDNKICFSKKQVKVCWADATPKEVLMKEVPFFCVARDYHGFVLRRMAEFGEKIENAGRFRNEYIRHVSEPLKC